MKIKCASICHHRIVFCGILTLLYAHKIRIFRTAQFYGINEMDELTIRIYQKSDEEQIINLWFECGLFAPWNNPKRDIERKMNKDPGLFLVGEIERNVVCSCIE